MIDKPGVIHGMSHQEYHSLTDVVSNSYLGRLDECPAAAKVIQKDTPAMQFGRAFHSFLLDDITSLFNKIAIAPPYNARTNEGKAIRDAFYSQNEEKDILTEEEYKTLSNMQAAVFAHPFANKLLREGISETSIFWTDKKTGLPCKCRPDRIPDGDHGVLVDVKSAISADKHSFTNAIVRFGYAREAGIYIEGYNAVTGSKVDAFAFIVVEKEEPYRVEVYILSDEFIEWGQSEFHRLLSIEADCRKNNLWPHYINAGADEIQMPIYLYK